jgi:tetratricopeptide (TPR) repeat protein
MIGAVLAVVLGILTWQRNLDYRTELEIWSDTVAKRPGNTRARGAMATSLENAGDAEGALRELTHCIEQEPEGAQHYLLRGTVYLNLDRLEEAFADFSRSIELTPSAGALQNRGLVYCRLKQFEPAIADFDAALRLDNTLLLAYRNRALSHFYLQHFDEARRDIQEFRARGGTPDQDLLVIEDFLRRSTGGGAPQAD